MFKCVYCRYGKEKKKAKEWPFKWYTCYEVCRYFSGIDIGWTFNPRHLFKKLIKFKDKRKLRAVSLLESSMSGGGNDDANWLLDGRKRQQKEELEQKRLAVAQQRMAVIKAQGTQQFKNPDNPNPPAQVIQ